MSTILPNSLPPEISARSSATRSRCRPAGFLALGLRASVLHDPAQRLDRPGDERGGRRRRSAAARWICWRRGPVPRWQFVAAGAAATALGLPLIIVSAWIGTAVGVGTRELGILATDLIPVAAGAWLLFTAWAGVGLAISATRRDGGQAIGWTTTILVVSFVLDYLARLWAPISGLRALSLFRYYEPQAIFTSGLPGTHDRCAGSDASPEPDCGDRRDQ